MGRHPKNWTKPEAEDVHETKNDAQNVTAPAAVAPEPPRVHAPGKPPRVPGVAPEVFERFRAHLGTLPDGRDKDAYIARFVASAGADDATGRQITAYLKSQE